MNDAAMPPVVLVIAGNKLAKSKFADLKDVSAFAKPVAVSAAKLPHFPSTKLTVLAESGTMFYDLLAADPKIGQIFQADGPLRPAYRRFKSLYISSEHVPAASAAAAGAAAAPAAAAGGGEGKVCTVQLTFSLPPAAAGGGGFDEVAPLVQLVPLIIDFLGESARPGCLAAHA